MMKGKVGVIKPPRHLSPNIGKHMTICTCTCNTTTGQVTKCTSNFKMDIYYGRDNNVLWLHILFIQHCTVSLDDVFGCNCTSVRTPSVYGLS